MTARHRRPPPVASRPPPAGSRQPPVTFRSGSVSTCWRLECRGPATRDVVGRCVRRGASQPGLRQRRAGNLPQCGTGNHRSRVRGARRARRAPAAGGVVALRRPRRSHLPGAPIFLDVESRLRDQSTRAFRTHVGQRHPQPVRTVRAPRLPLQSLQLAGDLPAAHRCQQRSVVRSAPDQRDLPDAVQVPSFRTWIASACASRDGQAGIRW